MRQPPVPDHPPGQDRARCVGEAAEARASPIAPTTSCGPPARDCSAVTSGRVTDLKKVWPGRPCPRSCCCGWRLPPPDLADGYHRVSLAYGSTRTPMSRSRPGLGRRPFQAQSARAQWGRGLLRHAAAGRLPAVREHGRRSDGSGPGRHDVRPDARQPHAGARPVPAVRLRACARPVRAALVRAGVWFRVGSNNKPGLVGRYPT